MADDSLPDLTQLPSSGKPLSAASATARTDVVPIVGEANSTGSETDQTLIPASGSAISDASAASAASDATRVQQPSGPRKFGAAGLPDVPGYKVTREVARGGMGVVYLAHDPTFERDVAIKVMHLDQDADRFVIESKVTAQLPHPGVPPVYQLGALGDGRPFLAMKLIQGRTLSDELRASSHADLPRLLGVFEQICLTVGFAHSRGIIHRDLKPANVMVGAFGETLVMDWGLAKHLDRKRDAGDGEDTVASGTSYKQPLLDETLAGQVIGTPAYMAPEQARGEPVDARADVFALGGILSAILTGKAPFGGTTVHDTIRSAASADLTEVYARLDASGADPELLAVGKRCLAARADERYADGVDVAHAVAAHRASVEERLHRAERERAAVEARTVEQRKRRKVQLLLAASVLMLACGAGAFAWWRDKQATERQMADERAEAERQRIETAGKAESARIESEGKAEAMRIAGERKAAEGRADMERDFKVQQARQGVAANLKLADELRKQHKFKAAETALAQAAELTKGAPELLPNVERARRDLAFVARLDDIRYRKWFWNAGSAKTEAGFNTKIAPPEYRKAFAAHDLDLAALDPEEAAKRIAASAVAVELVAAVDDWSLYESDEALRDRLLSIAKRAEPGEWTDRLRDSAVRKSLLGLDRLAMGAAEANPRPAAVCALAELMIQTKLDPSALLATARARHPADFELSFVLAQWHMAKGPRTNALAPYEAARAVRPDNVTVWNNMGVVLYESGDVSGALAAFTRTVEIDPKYAPAHNNVGKILADRDDRAGAIKAYKLANAADPRHTNAHLGLGNVLADEGDYPGAIKAYRALLEVDPDHAIAHNNLGNALAKSGDPQGAVKEYEKAIECDGTYAEPWHGLGRVLADNNNPNDAAKAYRKALEIDPKHLSSLINLGNLLRRTDPNAAVAMLKKATEVAPKNAVAHYNLGLALRAKGDLKAARAAYLEAIEHDEDFFEAYTNLSGVLNDLGEFNNAIEAAKEAIRCRPKDSRPHNNIGIALISKKDFDGAIKAFKQAVELNPKNQNAKDNLEQSIKEKAAHERLAPPPREKK